MAKKKMSRKQCNRTKGKHWVTGSKKRKGYCAKNARRRRRRSRR